jgi:hypothetical protein
MWVRGQSKQQLNQAHNGIGWGMQQLLLGLAPSQSDAGLAAGKHAALGTN